MTNLTPRRGSTNNESQVWDDQWTTASVDVEKSAIKRVLSAVKSWGNTSRGSRQRRSITASEISEPVPVPTVVIEEAMNQLIFKDGHHYEGGVERNRMHGFGRYFSPIQQLLYEGEFQDGFRHGRGSAFHNGAIVFNGEWVADKRNGFGVLHESCGGSYEGMFKENHMEGSGCYKFSNGDQYVGEFLMNKFQGEGQFRYANGDVYTGQWHNGCQHGLGKLVYAQGDYYDGEWREDKRCGKGVYSCSVFRYEGDWVGDAMHGIGEYRYENNDVYVGHFENDTESGHGVYTFCNGGYYDGEWKNGLRHGTGTYLFASGEGYTGEWYNNLKHGTGKYTYITKCYYEGEWNNDEPHGAGIYVNEQGKATEVAFDAGHLLRSETSASAASPSSRSATPIIEIDEGGVVRTASTPSVYRLISQELERSLNSVMPYTLSMSMSKSNQMTQSRQKLSTSVKEGEDLESCASEVSIVVRNDKRPNDSLTLIDFSGNARAHPGDNGNAVPVSVNEESYSAIRPHGIPILRSAPKIDPTLQQSHLSLPSGHQSNNSVLFCVTKGEAEVQDSRSPKKKVKINTKLTCVSHALSELDFEEGATKSEGHFIPAVQDQFVIAARKPLTPASVSSSSVRDERPDSTRWRNQIEIIKLQT